MPSRTPGYGIVGGSPPSKQGYSHHRHEQQHHHPPSSGASRTADSRSGHHPPSPAASASSRVTVAVRVRPLLPHEVASQSVQTPVSSLDRRHGAVSGARRRAGGGGGREPPPPSLVKVANGTTLVLIDPTALAAAQAVSLNNSSHPPVPPSSYSRSYTFDFCYAEDSEQSRVHDDLGVRLLGNAWNGYNCSIFACECGGVCFLLFLSGEGLLRGVSQRGSACSSSLRSFRVSS